MLIKTTDDTTCKDVKNSCQKGGNIFPMSIADITMRNQTAVRNQTKN